MRFEPSWPGFPGFRAPPRDALELFDEAVTAGPAAGAFVAAELVGPVPQPVSVSPWPKYALTHGTGQEINYSGQVSEDTSTVQARELHRTPARFEQDWLCSLRF
ncbi:MAG: hypothetical protein KAY24_11920 [Candidatus Eisenbacteria sp.]|nr:hypothetical protein [Candidatus Eisenbacteria bacterium]